MTQTFIFTIFGATGDLAHNKLIPALFALYKDGKLPKEFFIIGFARRALDNISFANLFDTFVTDPQWEAFASHLLYHHSDFDNEDGYKTLAQKINTNTQQVKKPLRHIFYLATPPQNYETILGYLYTYKKELSQEQSVFNKYARLVIEKPFGKDLETAKMLDQKLHDLFSEWQVFRVDHYLV